MSLKSGKHGIKGGVIKSTSVYFLSRADFAVGKTAIRALHGARLPPRL
jgi:hypothetical protein